MRSHSHAIWLALVPFLGTSGCKSDDTRRSIPSTVAEAAAARQQGAQVIDSAPSVEPVPGSDTTNPELDSIKTLARKSGVPESLIPDASASSGPQTSTLSSPTSQSPGAASATGVPLVSGLRIVSTLVFPDGDRDNVVTTTVTEGGVTYSWHLRQQAPGGRAQEYDLKRFVRANDLAGAPRMNDVVSTDGPNETPGYTFVSLSRAVYQKLRETGQAPFTVTGMEDGLLGGAMGGVGASRVTYKGAFTVVSQTPTPIPVLLDGRRTTLPALHLQGKFAFQEKRQDGEYWVLADSTHPLILKELNGRDVLQVVRIDRPSPAAAPTSLEAELSKDCRAEVPGIYFSFASAILDPASTPALDRVAAMLERHAEWTLSIEGHTDSVGNAAANQKLSQQRAEAVRAALIARPGIAAQRVTATGYGSTRPRESNATIEGRARNRRVELVRSCEGR
jgi:outer membrane protein OmpA-like peptidoglycan-associated protein